MKFEVENITPYENEDESGIIARVYIIMGHGPGNEISVPVRLPAFRELNLGEVTNEAIKAAKIKLKEAMAAMETR
ncbi:hypothetical protein ACMV5I_02105 [Serratia sp. T13T92]|uniref:hypothetical protein n=1 Tax=Serratia sp. T13T92 TaxID=3397496 RepID=UPI0039E1BCDF